MAQADSVHSSVHVLITGASAKRSTNPVKLAPCWPKKTSARSTYLYPYSVDLSMVHRTPLSYSTTREEMAQSVCNGRNSRKITVILLNVTSEPAAILQTIEVEARRAA
jgi:hypothetical protein